VDEPETPTASAWLSADVMAALARLETLDGLDTASHVAVFELVQAELAAALADIDMPPGGGPAAAEPEGPVPGTSVPGNPVPGNPARFDRRPVPGRPPR
jgi:hypothetical protein